MKQQFGVSNLAEAKKLALDTAKAAAVQVNQLGEDLAQKALSKVSKSRLPPAVKETTVSINLGLTQKLNELYHESRRKD